MTWQDTDSAPIETPVLLYCPDLPEGDQCSWSDGIKRPAAMNSKIVAGIWRGREEAGRWVCDIVSKDAGYYGDVDIDPISIDPSHWMPLPEPPKLP